MTTLFGKRGALRERRADKRLQKKCPDLRNQCCYTFKFWSHSATKPRPPSGIVVEPRVHAAPEIGPVVVLLPENPTRESTFDQQRRPTKKKNLSKGRLSLLLNSVALCEQVTLNSERKPVLTNEEML